MALQDTSGEAAPGKVTTTPWWQPGAAWRMATMRWGGRSRPATGGGAISDVGLTPQVVSAPFRSGFQPGHSSMALAMSVNPHAPPVNVSIVHSDSGAPGLGSFIGLGALNTSNTLKFRGEQSS